VFSGFLKQVANPTFQGSPEAPACLILVNFLAILDSKNWPFGVQNDPLLGWPWAQALKGLDLGGEWAYIPVF
jgi:hypothetical protein